MSNVTDKQALVTAEQDAAAAEVSADIVARASGGLSFWTCMAISLAVHVALLGSTSVADIKNVIAGRAMVAPVEEEGKKPLAPSTAAPVPANPAATTPTKPAPAPAAPGSTAAATGSDSGTAGTPVKPKSKLEQGLEETLPPQAEPPKHINLDSPDLGIK